MKTDKKELIFKATEELISEAAYNDITVDAIAKKAGIGKGSVYYYFKSKDEIIYAVVERSYRRAIRDFFENIHNRPETSALEKMKLLFYSIIKQDYSDNEKNMLHKLNLHEDPDIHHKINVAAIQEIAPVVEQLMYEGIAEGTIHSQTPKESAEVIVAVLTYFLDRTMYSEDPQIMLNRMKLISEVMETCLKAEKGSFDYLYKLN